MLKTISHDFHSKNQSRVKIFNYVSLTFIYPHLNNLCIIFHCVVKLLLNQLSLSLSFSFCCLLRRKIKQINHTHCGTAGRQAASSKQQSTLGLFRDCIVKFTFIFHGYALNWNLCDLCARGPVWVINNTACEPVCLTVCPPRPLFLFSCLPAWPWLWTFSFSIEREGEILGLLISRHTQTCLHLSVRVCLSFNIVIIIIIEMKPAHIRERRDPTCC